MEWDYFKPNPSEYCKSASKRYVDTRDDTVLKTALAKVAELNKEEQADWNETDTRKDFHYNSSVRKKSCCTGFYQEQTGFSGCSYFW